MPDRVDPHLPPRPPRLLVGPLLRHVGRTDATVWVETDTPCTVVVEAGGAEHRERTWTVAGHYYALVLVAGLEPDSSVDYTVRLDDEPVWPVPGSSRPPSRIRTGGGTRPVRLAFGSCRYGRAAAKLDDKHFDPDSLACFARLLAGSAEEPPDAILMLGDQVYADETSVATQRRIRARRSIDEPPGAEVRDFEEYTWLYLESWTDPDVRWLLSTVPSAMIFDDHDVRDDWNTSHEWRRDMQQTSWWQERIVGGLSSYWVYQHIGNLTAEELATHELYQRVRACDGDAEPLLREFAIAADAEADGAKGARWSYRRDYGRVRLLMIDSRCGRILAENQRSMLSEDEFAWIEDQVEGDYDHLVIGTSLPWLMARALHELQAWNEVLCDGARGRRVARWSEKLRRAADLEHWAAFRRSFERLGRLVARVGSRPDAPASVCVISGDVHHAYVAEASFDQPLTARVFQLTCSPLHNYVPWYMKIAFRISWGRVTDRITRALLGLVARAPRASVSWSRVAGPFFGNELAELAFDGRQARSRLRKSTADGTLTEVDRRELAV